MGKTWTAWIRWTLGVLASTGVFGAASYLSARASFRPPPSDPSITDICTWAVSGQDPVALGLAIIAGLSALASAIQLFGPKPATRRDVREDGFRTRQGLEELSRQVASESTARHGGHAALLDAINTSRIGFTPDDIRCDRISEANAIAFGEAIIDYLRRARPDLAGDLIDRIGDVVTSAAESGDHRQREVAALMAEGQFAEAGSLLKTIAGAQDQVSAEAHRAAARVLTLTSPNEAMAEFTRALNIDPSDFRSWIELGHLSAHDGRVQDALRCAEQADQFAKGGREKKMVQTLFGDIARDVGDYDVAEQRYKEATYQDEQLAANCPDDFIKQHDVIVGKCKLGRISFQQKNYHQAHLYYQSALSVANLLVGREPDEPRWQKSLFSILAMLGASNDRLGHHLAAERYYLDANSMIDTAVEMNPEDRWLKRELVVSHNYVGDFARRRGDLYGARLRFEKALRVIERFVMEDPDNFRWQRDLEVSLNHLGTLFMETGELHEGGKLFERSLAIARRLAEQVPSNAEWNHDLVTCLTKMANFYRAMGQRRKAARLVAEATRLVRK